MPSRSASTYLLGYNVYFKQYIVVKNVKRLIGEYYDARTVKHLFFKFVLFEPVLFVIAKNHFPVYVVRIFANFFYTGEFISVNNGGFFRFCVSRFRFDNRLVVSGNAVCDHF